MVLSLDGRREVNDHMRPTVNGKGSYDVIVPKFQQLVSQRGTKDYYVRGTFTRENLDFADDVEHLASLGFRHVSVEPASGPLDDPFAIKEGDLPAVEAEYEKLARQLHSPISSWKARILLTVPSICRTLEVMFSAIYWSTGSGRFMPRRMALFLMMAMRVS